MATIYQKTVSDKTVILAPREYFMRPFDFQNWTEMRFGLFFGGVAASGDNTDASGETVSISSVSDLITFGIKNKDTTDLPGVAGSLFLGATSANASPSTLGAGSPSSSFSSSHGNPSDLAATGYNGVTKILGTNSDVIDSLYFPAVASASSGYNGFYALKFVISNLGGATQSVDISVGSDGAIAGTDYSASALRVLINNATYGTARTVAWNSGGVALAIPDAIWIRMPFYSNRIRISCMRAIRYAP